MKYPFKTVSTAAHGLCRFPTISKARKMEETVGKLSQWIPRMHLTKFSDYALRVLMLAAAHEDQRVTIEETAATFGISHGHLKKVVLAMTRAGYLHGIKGRNGGYTLACNPKEINLGEVLRITETDFTMFECVQDGQPCPILGPCCLPSVGRKAAMAFLNVFDQVTLADVALPGSAFSFINTARG
jgi:Rrf2 family transcriptional regulator, nitric oxide-sensitive transcriptional repressor